MFARRNRRTAAWLPPILVVALIAFLGPLAGAYPVSPPYAVATTTVTANTGSPSPSDYSNTFGGATTNNTTGTWTIWESSDTTGVPGGTTALISNQATFILYGLSSSTFNPTWNNSWTGMYANLTVSGQLLESTYCPGSSTAGVSAWINVSSNVYENAGGYPPSIWMFTPFQMIHDQTEFYVHSLGCNPNSFAKTWRSNYLNRSLNLSFSSGTNHCGNPLLFLCIPYVYVNITFSSYSTNDAATGSCFDFYAESSCYGGTDVGSIVLSQVGFT
jgi:hypothetical protein